MLLAAAPLLRAERIDVSGRVTDADRTPLLGVIVRAGAADGRAYRRKWKFFGERRRTREYAYFFVYRV